jgi:2-polyprenyl-3-methyl-5-hydroxy-6-metoxy-1,4-benzoquinol methylase
MPEDLRMTDRVAHGVPLEGYEELTGRARYFSLLARETEALIDPGTGALREDLSEAASCCVCGSPPPETAAFVKGGLRFVRCEECSQVYMHPRPAAEALRKWYEGESAANDAWVDVLLSAAEEEFQARDFGTLLDHVCAVRPDGDLLDIGCSIGRLGKMARDRGFRVVGLELGARAAEHARAVFGLDVHGVTLEAAAFPDGRFDVVTLIETLEHIPDPAAMLREIRRILRPGGLLVIGVPNATSLGVMVLGPLARTFNRNHLHYFSEHTLGRLLEREGFGVAWAGTHVSLLQTVLNHLQGEDPFSAPVTGSLPNMARQRLADPVFREALEQAICDLGLGYRLRMIATKA